MQQSENGWNKLGLGLFELVVQKKIKKSRGSKFKIYKDVYAKKYKLRGFSWMSLRHCCAVYKILCFVVEFIIIIVVISLNVQVKNVIEKPHNDHLPLIEASRFILLVFSCHLSFWSDYNFTGIIVHEPITV
jgi:hypothetical protein